MEIDKLYEQGRAYADESETMDPEATEKRAN